MRIIVSFTFSFGLNACIRLLHLASSLSTLATYTLQTTSAKQASKSMYNLNGKYSERVQIPARAITNFFDRYITSSFADVIQHATVKCKQSPVYRVF